jgi:hypothetical protein
MRHALLVIPRPKPKPRAEIIINRIACAVPIGKRSKPLAALLCFMKLDGSPARVALQCGIPAADFERELRTGLALLRADESFRAAFHSLRTRL